MTGIGENTLAQPVKPPLRERCACLAKLVKNRLTLTNSCPTERKGTTCALMERALTFYEGLGVAVERVMTDNGPAYRSGEFNALLEARGIGHKYTRPFSPWQNGKVERMNRTLAREWQYARAWESEDARASDLASFIECYNWDRPRSACGGLPPMSRIVGVNNVLAHNNGSRRRSGRGGRRPHAPPGTRWRPSRGARAP